MKFSSQRDMIDRIILDKILANLDEIDKRLVAGIIKKASAYPVVFDRLEDMLMAILAARKVL